jgi:hypothetical protein
MKGSKSGNENEKGAQVMVKNAKMMMKTKGNDRK